MTETAQHAQRWWRSPWLMLAIKWSLGIGVIALLMWLNRDQFQRLRTETPRWNYMALAGTVCLGSIILTFFRWYLLVKAQDFPFTMKDALRIGFLGFLFNYVAPGAVGGDLVKAGLMVREQQNRRTVAVATILLDRILGLLALLMVGAGAAFFVESDFERRDEIVMVLWSGSAAGLVGLLVMLHPATPRSRWLKLLTRLPKVGHLIDDVSHAIAMYQQRRLIVVATVAISLVGHFGIISSFYFCAVAIGGSQPVPDYATHLLLIPLAEIVGVFFPAPAGVGGLEWGVSTAYRISGFESGLGLLAAGAYRVTTIVIAIGGGIYYLAARRQIQNALAAAEEAIAETPA